VRREEEKATISWKIKFRDGREKDFVSPIRTTPWGSIKSPAEYEAPSADAMNSQQLAHEPEALKIDALPTLTPDRFKQGLA
jgi:adenylylsulfate reductase, subunit B